MPRSPLLLVALLTQTGCGPSIEDHVERLASSGDDLIRARHELLVVGFKAVAPLLVALEYPQNTAARPEVASLLVDLMTRLEDERIAPALQRHLLTDPDGRVRARICFDVGFYERSEFADAFLEALHDTLGQVRAHAMTALARMKSDLSDTQRDSLLEAARLMQGDESEEARLEAEFVVAAHVEEWMREAGEQRLKGLIAEAESLYCVALEYAPDSRKANRALGTLHLENGQEERGLQVLRESGWLVDVPRFAETPQIDGRLDDEVWRQAGRIGPLYIHTGLPGAPVKSKHPTLIRVFHTGDALLFGIRCEDAHPDSLFIRSRERDHRDYPNQDLFEVVIDPEFDRQRIFEISVNGAAAVIDAVRRADRTWDFSWDAVSEAAVHLGSDYWSIEYQMPFGAQPEIPRPRKGDWWGVRLIRGYREEVERSSWTQYHSGSTDRAYGWFLFQ